MYHVLNKGIVSFKTKIIDLLGGVLSHFKAYCPQSFYRWLHAKQSQTSNEYSCIAKKRIKHTANSICSSKSGRNFDDTQSIFIHIPKTAGMAVAHGLYGSWEESVYPCEKMGHAPLKKYQWIFSQAEFNRYFKFTFVRNPWDRVFSAYSYLVQGGFHANDRQWAAINIANFSFEEFVLKRLSCNPGILEWVHFIPQYQFLISYTMQKYPIDFIGFFENLKEDFDTIKARINPGAKLEVTNPIYFSVLSKALHRSDDSCG